MYTWRSRDLGDVRHSDRPPRRLVAFMSCNEYLTTSSLSAPANASSANGLIVKLLGRILRAPGQNKGSQVGAEVQTT